MKLTVYGVKGEAKGEVSVARLFSHPVRHDIIQRAFLAERSQMRQPYGTDPLAGQRTSAHYHGMKDYRWTMKNREMARAKRIHGQGYLNYTARFVPHAVKGRMAHPPKAERIWKEKINKKERLKAILSAISASSNRELVILRHGGINGVKTLPIVVDDNIQGAKKIKEVVELLKSLGLGNTLEDRKSVRAGRGKARGRKYRRKKGPLLIVKEDKGVVKAARNISGVDVVTLKQLSVNHLAPGGHAGRLCIWTKSAIEEAEKTLGLF